MRLPVAAKPVRPPRLPQAHDAASGSLLNQLSNRLRNHHHGQLSPAARPPPARGARQTWDELLPLGFSLACWQTPPSRPRWPSCEPLPWPVMPGARRAACSGLLVWLLAPDTARPENAAARHEPRPAPGADLHRPRRGQGLVGDHRRNLTHLAAEPGHIGCGNPGRTQRTRISCGAKSRGTLPPDDRAGPCT